MLKKYRKWIIVFILLIAFILRINKITQVPPSLNWDEASIGYNAYSIIKTGRDEWGKTLPIHFKSFGEYKLPGQIYASIPAIALFGLNPFGVRITPVIYGTLTVLFLYFLTKELFKKESIALVSAFLLAISPWHIQLTRGSFESSFALMWVVLGVWLFVKGFKDSKWWIISMIPFALSVYTYNSARAFVPLLLFTLFVIYRKDILKEKKKAILSIVLFVLLMIPVMTFFVSGEGGARYQLVSITDEAGLIPRIDEARNLSTLPESLIPMFHNRPVYVGGYFIQNYLAHFTPDFLFISGAGHRQHHVQGIGQLYWVQALFLIVGISMLFKNKEKFKWLLLSWMLLAYVPVALTLDSIPHALRTLNAVPTYQIISAYGIYYLYSWLNKKNKIINYAFWIFVIVILMFQFAKYLNNYFNRYPVLYSRDWQYGYKQVLDYVGEKQGKYDMIVFSRNYGEPHIFTLFNLEYDPALYQNDPNLERFESNDWVWVLAFDKYYFPDLGDEGTRYKDIVAENPNKKILFIGKPGDFPNDINRLFTINFLNNRRAFEIIEKI